MWKTEPTIDPRASTLERWLTKRCKRDCKLVQPRFDGEWYVRASSTKQEKKNGCSLIHILLECDELFPLDGSYPTEEVKLKIATTIDRRIHAAINDKDVILF